MATRKTTGKKTTAPTKKTATKTKGVEQRVSSPKTRRSPSKLEASQKVSATKKSTRKKSDSEMTASEVSDAPRQRIITKKYLYAVIAVLLLIGLLFVSTRLWVVAWVDNKPITKFELYSLLEKRDEGKTAEELIVQNLLKSEGSKQNLTVSNSEIDAEIKKIEDQQGGAAQLDQILQLNRTTREDFRKLVELQLIKQKLFGQDVNVTDEDVNKYIEQNKDALPADVINKPESSEAAKLRENAKEQLKQMKINENFNKWLEGAMTSSRVMRVVPAPSQEPLMPAAPPPQQ